MKIWKATFYIHFNVDGRLVVLVLYAIFVRMLSIKRIYLHHITEENT